MKKQKQTEQNQKTKCFLKRTTQNGIVNYIFREVYPDGSEKTIQASVPFRPNFTFRGSEAAQ